jgi:hypothetical protein
VKNVLDFSVLDSLLFDAAVKGHLKIVKVLIDLGASINKSMILG